MEPPANPGRFNERFSHNEDAELDVRIGLAGGRIWLEQSLAITYFPRKSLTSLARQYVNHGRGRRATVRKHGLRPRLRQMLPPVLLVGNAACLLAAPLAPAMLLLPLLYMALSLAVGVVDRSDRGSPCTLLAGIPAVVMHLAWGYGYLSGGLRDARPAARAG